ALIALRACQGAQGGQVQQVDFALGDFQQTFARKTREQAADRFQCQAQEVADFFAAHAQNEFVRGVAKQRQALGQVQQEGSQALLGTQSDQHQHQPMSAIDFLAHQPTELLLQDRQLGRQTVQNIEADHTDLANFQGDGAGDKAIFNQA